MFCLGAVLASCFVCFEVEKRKRKKKKNSGKTGQLSIISLKSKLIIKFGLDSVEMNQFFNKKNLKYSINANAELHLHSLNILNILFNPVFDKKYLPYLIFFLFSAPMEEEESQAAKEFADWLPLSSPHDEGEHVQLFKNGNKRVRYCLLCGVYIRRKDLMQRHLKKHPTSTKCNDRIEDPIENPIVEELAEDFAGEFIFY